jgi:AraC family transcriptional activator FtrA
MDNKPKNRATGLHRVAVLLPAGVLPLDLVVPLTAFGRWPDHVYDLTGMSSHPYELSLVGEEDAACGPLLRAQQMRPLSSLAQADTVIVPGTVDPLRVVDPAVLEALQVAHARGVRMVSVCTGAFVLAAAGLLAGRTATTHWIWADQLRDHYGNVDVVPDQLYVDSGDVLTSAGMLASVDLCLHILRTDHGQLLANTVARFLVSAPHREGGQAQFIRVMPTLDDVGDVGRSSDWIMKHLDEPLTLDRIAVNTDVSVRTLSRRFKEVIGTSVMDWIIAQRLARARTLLETTDLPITEIAQRCGFASTQSLRSHFVERTRTTPSRYRAAFR